MFTNKIASYYSQGKVLIEAACLSTDTKPTTGVANGSKCIEMDTGKTYMFNEEDSEWEELPSSGGGGGGSSDFSTATVTFSGEKLLSFSSAILMEQESRTQTMGELGRFGPSQIPEVKVILGTEGAMAAISSSQGTISISGNIENIDTDTYIITGDCTITIS